MLDPRLIESDKHVRPTLICTWLTITSTHSGLGTGQVQAPRVWQTCHTHIYLGLKTCLTTFYLGLANILDLSLLESKNHT